MMPRTGEGGARRIAGCQCSLGGMFVQWCHGKEAGAPGPGEHRLDVEGDMMTMRSYHQTRMRVPAILAVLAMILVFAGCGGRVVSVACDAGVQYGNLSDGDQQDLYDMTLKSGSVSRGLWKVVISRSPSILDAKERVPRTISSRNMVRRPRSLSCSPKRTMEPISSLI